MERGNPPSRFALWGTWGIEPLFHSLRHSFNSALANAGVAEEVRMKLTGHSSKAMNERYTHLQVDSLKKAMSSMPLFGAKTDAGECAPSNS
jgi:integrase